MYSHAGKVGLLIVVLGASVLVGGCVKRSSYTNEYGYTDQLDEDVDYDDDDEGYRDGTYCATVVYYYSETGTRARYTLKVEIEDDELTTIYWPNGGWLDDSHFTTPDISDGDARFVSRRGVEYTVSVIGSEDECYCSNSVVTEDDLIRMKEEIEMQQIQEEEEELPAVQQSGGVWMDQQEEEEVEDESEEE